LIDKYLDPYQVIEGVNPGAYRFKLPEDYVDVPDIFNESDLRPYFDPGADTDLDLDQASLPVQAHPALDRVVQVLDRKSHGQVPKAVHILEIPAQYLCVRKCGAQEWIQGRHLKEPEELALVKKFEWRFPRSTKLPYAHACASVSHYNPERSAMMSWT
jgi:hypothetical protein